MSDHLRNYQVNAVDAVFKEWEVSRSAILDQATGTGKTVEICEVVRRAQPRRALILAHRRQLIFQAKGKMDKFTSLSTQIEMGTERARRDLFRDCHAVVSSVQSQTPGRRSKPEDFDILIIDECHHLKPKNKSYMDVLNHYRQNPNLKILGVTATLEPECLKVLEKTKATFHYGILDAIKDGYLVNVQQKVAHIQDLDYSHVRTVAGDFNTGDLAAVMEAEKPCQRIIQATLETMFSAPQHSLLRIPVEQWSEFLYGFGKPKKNLIFTVTVNQARMISDILNRVNPGMSEWVCGDTKLVPEEDRIRIGKKFEEGDLPVVCNCGIYSEGYDNPRIEMITMARPTKSLTLYIQQLGRGTRILEGVIDGITEPENRLSAILGSAKKVLTVLDLAGNSGRHNLVTAIDIFAGKISNDVRKRAESKAKKSDGPRNIAELIKESEDELRIEKLRREKADAERRKHLVAKSTYSITEVSPFLEHKFERPNTWQRMNGRPLPDWLKNLIREKAGEDPNNVSNKSAWDWYLKYKNRPPSQKQLGLMKRLGITTIPKTATEASKLISAVKGTNGSANPTAYYQPPPLPSQGFPNDPPIEYYDEVPV